MSIDQDSYDQGKTNSPRHIMVIGQGGREASIAHRLREHCTVSAVLAHKNPTIAAIVGQSGGTLFIGDPNSPDFVADAAGSGEVDLVFVSGDSSIAAGVCDVLIDRGIPCVGPTRAAAQIEWDKAFSRRFLADTIPHASPRFWVVHTDHEVESIIAQLQQQNIPVAVKPQGLTGGKGVKVMGAHLNTFDDAKSYAVKILADNIGNSDCVVFEEFLSGQEFTLQVITDGKTAVFPPASYDYPFRFEQDQGPGTGGMGALVGPNNPLPFMQPADWEACCAIATDIIQGLADKNYHYNGVLNVGFFLTEKGPFVFEVNSRFGDPECMNIMDYLDYPVDALCFSLCNQTLDTIKNEIRWRPGTSVVWYLVPPEYGLSAPRRHTFTIDVDAIEQLGCQVYFSSATATEQPNEYETIGSSRTVAISALAGSAAAAADKIEQAIGQYVSGPLEYRRDIGRNL